MQKNQQILTGIILLVLLIGLGTVAVILLSETQTTPEGSDQSNLEGFTTEQLTPGSIQVDDLRAFNGTFQELSGNALTLTIESGEEVQVSINDDTRFIRREVIDPEEFDRRYQEFLEETQNQEIPTEGDAPELPTPPSPFVEETFDPSELSQGDQILLQTVENARETRTLTAESIILQEIPTEPVEITPAGEDPTLTP
jgi:hypothetical protein